ncbi:hypothetical protein MTO96_008721 [Rhipicephalus appendiculatus]
MAGFWRHSPATPDVVARVAVTRSVLDVTRPPMLLLARGALDTPPAAALTDPVYKCGAWCSTRARLYGGP